MTSPRPVAEAENRLERFNGEREAILAAVDRRVVSSCLEAAARAPEASLEYVLNDVAFSEIRRLEGATSKGGRKSLARWRDLAAHLGRMSHGQHEAELRRLVHHYAEDIVGNFNPRVYRFANDLLPPALSLLFSPLSSVRDGVEALGSFARRIRVEGALAAVHTACDRGTVILAPTHSSHMDSIVLGFGLRRAALPPVTYGAGKNLFSNPLLSFFMHNLGAYKVDRRLKFNLYKDVLKAYSTVLLERGYHSLFFPGGTRSRSNQVEHKLKLGLLGTGITAYVNGLREGQRTRRVYVVPVTINYRLVLEAETLIEDYLAETGKSRYIIEDDEFSRIGRIVEFVRKTLVHEGSVVVRFGQPLDPFGNQVDDTGESLDRRGRRLDPARLAVGDGDQVVVDEQRDSVYTRGLGGALAAGFRRETVFLPTHLLARALYDALVDDTRTRDIYRLLRLPPERLSVPVAEAARRIEALRQRIAERPADGCLADELRDQPVEAIIADGVRALSTYHSRAVVERVGDRLQVGALKLLYYYRNRSAHIAEAS